MSEARFAWLVSYPRSGNKWLRFLIASLLQDGAPVDINAPSVSTPVANRREFDDLFGIDSTILPDDEVNRARPLLYRAIAERFKGPLILRKVHDRCWRNRDGARLFPPELSRGAVYIARDPRDVVVSYAHFAGKGIDEIICRMCDPDATLPGSGTPLPQFPQPLGTWSEHVLSWLDESGMPVHLVRYEDLLQDPAAQLAGVAVFLGISPEAAERAAAAVRFEALSKQEAALGFRESPASDDRLFRQGKAGEWGSVLSATQAERLQKVHGDVMVRLGYL